MLRDIFYLLLPVIVIAGIVYAYRAFRRRYIDKNILK